LTPVIPLPTGVKPTALTTLSFTTARVDSKGLVTKFPGRPTQQYEEDLGGGVKLEMVAVKGDGKVRDLWMGKYEVTQEQWQAVMGENPSNFKGDRLPVESVSWEEVKEYCRRLNAKLGLTEADGYRLPTEAEWEYAARAGTTTAYAFGETISPEIVNYDGNYPDGNAPKGIYRARTVEVGSLGAANGWGLYDMHGNVWEWCEDEFRSAGAAVRVIRGGGWYYGAVNCRSALRYRAAPGDRAGSLGFRLSRTLP
jgi:formylglycine-generating enzyme required for sulfatase activity